MTGLAGCWFDEAPVQIGRWGVSDGGPVLGDEHAALKQTILGRHYHDCDPNAEYQHRITGQHAYLGIIDHHFGHLMSEGIHRIVPTRFAGIDAPFVVVAKNPGRYKQFDQLGSVPRTIYEFLGLNNDNTIIINNNTIVERLYVAEQGSDGVPKPAYLGMLADFTPRRLAEYGPAAKSERIYVSRSRLGPQARLFGERYLEQQLQRSGISIYHPQEHAFVDQLRTYQAAESLIFSEGSSIHGVELFGSRAMSEVIVINRRERGPAKRMANVIAPRARRMRSFLGNPYLGSMTIDVRSGTALRNFGAGLCDVPALLAFMRRSGIDVDDSHWNFDHFEACAREDLHAYVTSPSKGRAHAVGSAELERMNATFEAALRRIRTAAIG